MPPTYLDSRVGGGRGHPNRSASFSINRRLQKEEAPRVRPATAGASELPHILPCIDEPVDDIATILNMCHPPVPIVPPTILIDRAPTPQPIILDPNTVATSHQNPHVSPAAHPPPHPHSESTPSDGPSSSANDFITHPHDRHVQSSSTSELFVSYESDGLVKWGTLPGLIGLLISGSEDFNKDAEFKETFLTSYRAFIDANKLLRLLIERFEAVSSPEYSTKERANVRYSVFKIFKLWLDENHVNAEDAPLLKEMREFAVSVQASITVSLFRDSAQKLIRSIDNSLDILLSPVPPLTPSSSFSSLRSPRAISNITPQMVATVLTSMESVRYRGLRVSDIIAWLDGDRGSNAVSFFLTDNKKLQYWAHKVVLRPHGSSERAENLKYFLRVIQECTKLRNFSSACALMAGLATASVIGLKRTYGGLDKQSLKTFDEMRKLISVDKNFKAYRTALNADRPTKPCVPWLSVHLHDVKIIHRAYPIFVDKDGRIGLINFVRFRRVHRRIRQALSYQVPIIEPASCADLVGVESLVNVQLDSLMVDDGLRDWLVERGSILSGEEQINYETHEDELIKTGFIKATTAVSLSTPSRQTSPLRRQTTTTSSQPVSLRQENVISPITPSEPPDLAVNNVFPLDVFNRNSERCLDGRITHLSQHPVAFGGYADVWEGRLGQRKVAVKILRPFSSTGNRIEEDKLLKRLWREYSAWTWVSHPIVLECLGFSYGFSPQPYDLPSLISPWMSNGTLTTYLEKHPNMNRFRALVDVAEGLSFLHSQYPSIIHGDLRGGNILISDEGRPCLSDFGLSRVLRLEGMTTTSDVAGSLRWMSPELVRDDAVPSTSSDVWAYGMTILEIMSGRVPYYEVKNSPAVLTQISQGQIPLRPQDMSISAILTDDIWAICQKCWNIIPRQRPSMQDVFCEMQSIDR